MSRFGAQPRVTDNAQTLYTQAAQQTLALLEHKDYSEIVKTALRYVDNDATQLTNLLVTMLAKRDQWLTNAQGEIDVFQLQNTLQYLVSAALKEAASAVPIALQQWLMPIANFAAANLVAENATANQPLLKWHAPLQALPDHLESWRALADFVLTDKGEPRKEKGLTVKFGFPPNDAGKVQKQAFANATATLDNFAALHRVRQLPNIQSDPNHWQIIATLSSLLNLAVAQLWLVFQRAGEVDFVEISQRATQA